MKNKDKKFTWADLKKVINRMPEKFLKDEVIIWTDRDDDASGFVVRDVEILKEDYLFNGDEACEPRSVLKEQIKEEQEAGTFIDGDYQIVHPKGRRILYAE